MTIITNLKKQMNNHFNIYDNYKLNNFTFDFMGEFLMTNSKYFLSKKNVVWGYENKEYVFVKELDSISENYIEENILPLNEFAMTNIVNPTENHMSTNITFVLSSPHIDTKLTKKINSYKKRKSYRFGLRGYSNLRLILFDSNNNDFYYNKDSNEIIDFYKEAIK